MNKDQVYAFAYAIAEANGHPAPQDYANKVNEVYIEPKGNPMLSLNNEVPTVFNAPTITY